VLSQAGIEEFFFIRWRENVTPENPQSRIILNKGPEPPRLLAVYAVGY
jgi:hypothetical protein